MIFTFIMCVLAIVINLIAMLMNAQKGDVTSEILSATVVIIMIVLLCHLPH